MMTDQIKRDIEAVGRANEHLFHENEQLRGLLARLIGRVIDIGAIEPIAHEEEFSFDENYQIRKTNPVKLGMSSRRVDILTRAGLITPEKTLE